ncbi:MAG: c-type cytochrome biogenesis protein CcmI [Burkholderiaceae bacterium]|nr:c-type cytochrome biogenesis protein CcmI [Burkholderiaceae bacterium]
MTLFWILAAAMVVVALGVLLRPLLKTTAVAEDDTVQVNLRVLRDAMAELDAELAAGTLSAEQHAQARTELERRALEETAAEHANPRASGSPRTPGAARASALALAVLLPAAAVLLYAQLGNRRGLDPVLAQPPSHATAADIETLVQRLADRMKADPSDPQGWMLLGRAYSGLQRFEDARDAYREALQRTPPDADLLADYADVLAMTQGRTLAGEPEKLALQALALDPDHLKSLALAGSAAFERGDPKGALTHWTRARRLAPPGSPFAEGLDPGIAEARAAAGLPPEAVTAPPVAAAAAGGLQVTVSIDPALATRLQPGDTLFVFARAAEGPRMPVAIARLPATAQPAQVTLDDSSAMTPAMRLSGQTRVVVGARVSRSGNATPQPGDLEGESGPMGPSGSLTIQIDRVRE